jgi:hypothetical protein
VFFAAAILRRLALAATGEPRVATLAAGLLLCDPQVAAFAQTFRPEALHLAATLLVFELALVRAPRLATGAALGAAIAASVVLKSVLTPFLPLLVAAFGLRAPRPARLPAVAVAAGVCLSRCSAPSPCTTTAVTTSSRSETARPSTSCSG